MKVYKIRIEKYTQRCKNIYEYFDSMSWINKSLEKILKSLEKDYPNGNFMKIFTGRDRNSFILFTDVKDNLTKFDDNFIIPANLERPGIGKVTIYLLDYDLSEKKRLNILSHENYLSHVTVSSTYKFGPKSKNIFQDKTYWCRLAAHFDR